MLPSTPQALAVVGKDGAWCSTSTRTPSISTLSASQILSEAPSANPTMTVSYLERSTPAPSWMPSITTKPPTTIRDLVDIWFVVVPEQVPRSHGYARTCIHIHVLVSAPLWLPGVRLCILKCVGALVHSLFFHLWEFISTAEVFAECRQYLA